MAICQRKWEKRKKNQFLFCVFLTNKFRRHLLDIWCNCGRMKDWQRNSITRKMLKFHLKNAFTSVKWTFFLKQLRTEWMTSCTFVYELIVFKLKFQFNKCPLFISDNYYFLISHPIIWTSNLTKLVIHNDILIIRFIIIFHLSNCSRIAVQFCLEERKQKITNLLLKNHTSSIEAACDNRKISN